MPGSGSMPCLDLDLDPHHAGYGSMPCLDLDLDPCHAGYGSMPRLDLDPWHAGYRYMPCLDLDLDPCHDGYGSIWTHAMPGSSTPRPESGSKSPVRSVHADIIRPRMAPQLLQLQPQPSAPATTASSSSAARYYLWLGRAGYALKTSCSGSYVWPGVGEGEKRGGGGREDIRGRVRGMG